VASQLDFSLKVRNTTLQVVYGDVTRIEADALVSSDDVHLSAASGLSRAIREAAGERLSTDIRKFALPLPLGSVLVTWAGKLSAKYIFHTMTISFDQTPQFDVLVPRLIRRVLEIAALLNVERIAVPMINAGLVSVPPEVILRVIIEGASCFLASNPSPVRSILLTVYDDEAKDQEAAEVQLYKRLAEVRADMARWQAVTDPLNQRLALLQPVREQMGDDPELREVVEARIAAAEGALRELFNCAEVASEASALSGVAARVGGAPRNRAEYLKAKNRLDTLLANLQRHIDHLEKVQDIQEARFQQLELLEARKGNDTPVDIKTELEDVQAAIATRERELKQLQDQQDDAKQQLDMLTRRWERPGARRDEPVPPAEPAAPTDEGATDTPAAPQI